MKPLRVVLMFIMYITVLLLSSSLYNVCVTSGSVLRLQTVQFVLFTFWRDVCLRVKYETSKGTNMNNTALAVHNLIDLILSNTGDRTTTVDELRMLLDGFRRHKARIQAVESLIMQHGGFARTGHASRKIVRMYENGNNGFDNIYAWMAAEDVDEMTLDELNRWVHEYLSGRTIFGLLEARLRGMSWLRPVFKAQLLALVQNV